MTNGITARTPTWLAAAVPLLAAALIAVARGYRPFPAIDDFVYVPMAWSALDPGAFPGDWIIANYVLHAPIWVPLVAGLEATVGFPLGYWILTQVLTVAFCAVLYVSWWRLGGDPFGFLVLPVAIALGDVLGIGRGDFDGLIAPGFHVQSLALALLLGSYALMLVGRPLAAGVALALCAMSHPVVAAHGALVLAVAALWDGPGRWVRLGKTGLACAVAAAPLAIPLALALLDGGAAVDEPDAVRRAVVDGYLFRTPHEFALTATPLLVKGFFILVLLAGLAGGLRAWRAAAEAAADTNPPRRALGLLCGHGVLFALCLLIHLPLLPEPWVTASTWPYLLHLTRTTPVLLGLGLLLAAVGLSLAIRQRQPGDRLFVALMAATLGTAALYLSVLMVVAFWVAVILTALLVAISRRRHRRFIAPVAAIIVIGFATAAWRNPMESTPSEAAVGLYDWIRAETPDDALFIIPPGQERFRLYTRRSIVVDFKTFPASTITAIGEWRRRLEEVTRPDAAALARRGWPAVPYWDRAYAAADGARIAELFERTGAGYFVWPRLTMDDAPAPPDDLDAHGLAVLFGDAQSGYLVIGRPPAPS